MTASREEAVTGPVLTLSEFAALLRVSKRTAAARARAHDVGVNLGGSAGWRFTSNDVAELLSAMKPKPAPSRRRPRRS